MRNEDFKFKADSCEFQNNIVQLTNENIQRSTKERNLTKLVMIQVDETVIDKLDDIDNNIKNSKDKTIDELKRIKEDINDTVIQRTG
jgi:flagellar hook-basal body complex protein FliE